MNKRLVGKYNRGFTVVELIVIIMVIGILAGIASVSYGKSQSRARLTTYKNDIDQVKIMIEAYRNEHGEYPKTNNQADPDNWQKNDVNLDGECHWAGGSGNILTEWVPNLDDSLPQSDIGAGVGADGTSGCYIYASNGTQYVLSAWNVYDKPSTGDGYRRLGLREIPSPMAAQFYTCNRSQTGGVTGGSYNPNSDYYKHSYTLSNISDCNETPPAGA